MRSHVDEQFAIYHATLDSNWLNSVTHRDASFGRGKCKCYGRNWGLQDARVGLHGEVQDTQCAAWRKLVWMIDEAIAIEATRFSPLTDMPIDEREQIISLPPSIGKISKLEELNLYGSHIRRIPIEVNQLKNLVKFTPYTSYALHWFPYEYSHCKKLSSSTISTRALFGNFKSRPDFPELRPWYQERRVSDAFRSLYEQHWAKFAVRPCSVCRREFEDQQEFRYWISLGVGIDVVPLLVNACSQSCIDSLPTGAKQHITHPHKGGGDIVQPNRHY